MERERRIPAFRLLLPLKAPCTPPTRPARPRCQPPLLVPQRAARPPRRPPPPQPSHTSRPPPPSPRPLHTSQTNHAQISRREGNAAQRRQKRASDALHTDNIIHTGSSTDVHTYRHITHRYTLPPPRPHPRAPPTPASPSPGSPPPAPPPPAPSPPPARCRGKKGESRTFKRQRAPSRGRVGTLRGRTRRRWLSATCCADLPLTLPWGHEVPLGQEAPAEGCLSDCLETAHNFTRLWEHADALLEAPLERRYLHAKGAALQTPSSGRFYGS